ncbi:MAG: shikimate dehydrogenase [Solirubrobacterales bacterium]|jgi:shikimate dehydrogenase|nr:shikimate dehydrogenase [Solirubrobacterales bacterium]
MHSAALAEMGLEDWSYEAIEVSAEGFEALVRSLPEKGFAGVNVTVPHKVAALAVADEASDAAREIGAANTLTFVKGVIQAENTDATAIVDALPSQPEGVRALVMGAGGSARAAVWALREAGAAVNVWNRTDAKAEALADEMGVGLDTEDPEILVNATTVGLASANEVQPLPERREPDLKPFSVLADGLKAEVVMDLVYGSRDTDLIVAARAAGAATVDGLEILARQGAASLRIWTGADPPLDTMRRAARGLP